MSKCSKFVFFILLIALSSASLAGCSTSRLFTKPIAGTNYVTYPEWGPNRNVAVMPFINVSKDKDAGLKVRELFLTELYISGIFKDVVDEGEMYEVMKKLKVRETDNFGKDTIKTFGDNLGVQAVVFGTVEEYTERTAKGAQFVVSLRMVDVETGQILWLGNASEEGGGSIGEALGLSDGPTVIEVARGVLEGLVVDLASEVNKSRDVNTRRVAGKSWWQFWKSGSKPDDTARKGDGSNNTASGEKGPKQQAGATPPPASKGTSAGMASMPALGGK